MTVYVDTMFMPANVPNGGRQVRGVWCHLFSDSLDPAELHEMAEKIGMRRSWFQHRPQRPWHDHYDVTKSKRALAVAAGAVEVDCDEMVAINRVKRSQASAMQDRTTEPKDQER